MSPSKVRGSTLQATIDNQEPGNTLNLLPGEFFGQVVIDRPVTIVGRGRATWIGSRMFPTIRITAPGVVLKNLMVEVTTDPEGVAIEAAPESRPVLEDVRVTGALVGVPPENIRTGAAPVDRARSPITFLPPPPISSVGSCVVPHSSAIGSFSTSQAIGSRSQSSRLAGASRRSEMPRSSRTKRIVVVAVVAIVLSLGGVAFLYFRSVSAPVQPRPAAPQPPAAPKAVPPPVSPPKQRRAPESPDDVAGPREFAANRDAKAQFELGLTYQYLPGVDKDQAEGVKWYYKASERGNGDAKVALARVHGNSAASTRGPAKLSLQEVASAPQSVPPLKIGSRIGWKRNPYNDDRLLTWLKRDLPPLGGLRL